MPYASTDPNRFIGFQPRNSYEAENKSFFGFSVVEQRKLD